VAFIVKVILSRAYVRAIAGRAGLNLAIREYDYGVDSSFDEVVVRQNRRVESGSLSVATGNTSVVASAKIASP
jgi:hypothetical protein